jgi:hypothetical protein
VNCPRSDDVVARFLDGDVQGADDGLALHAASCATCRTALARSRRLDAALANACGERLGDEAAARILAAVRVPTPPPAAATPRRRVAATLAVGFVLGLSAAAAWGTSPWWSTCSELPQSTPSATPTASGTASEATSGAPLTTTPAPDLTPTFVLEGAGDVPVRAFDNARRRRASFDCPDLIAAAALQARARQFALGGRTAEVPAAIDAARIAVGREQLDSGAAIAALVPILHRSEPAARALLDHAAAHGAFRARLRTWLNRAQDPELLAAALAVAVRLGDPELDRRAIARCRRDESLADRLAAACAAPAQGVDRVLFLLDLWASMARGGDDDAQPLRDDAERARAWFQPLPDATAELLRVLATTRNNESRRRVVLALAGRADDAAIDSLLALLDGPSTPLAEVAAYALSRHGATAAARLRQVAGTTRRPDLAWAALLGMGDRRALAQLPRLGLGRTEAVLIGAVPLHPQQLAALATTLRNRPLALLNGK